MTKPAWTEGPWAARSYRVGGKNHIHIVQDRTPLARILMAPPTWFLDEDRDCEEWLEFDANMRLIAAAPDLYAALKAIKQFGELACVDAAPRFGSPSGKKPASKDVWQFPRHLLVDIDAALARAIGKD